MVELLPTGFVQLLVEFSGVLQQLERKPQPLLNPPVVRTGGCDQGLGITHLDLEGILTQLQVGHQDGVRQVGIEQLLLLSVQPLQPSALGVQQRGIVSPQPAELFTMISRMAATMSGANWMACQ